MFPITNGVPEADLLDELAVLDPHPAISKATSASSTESFVLFLRCKRRHVFGVANFAPPPLLVTDTASMEVTRFWVGTSVGGFRECSLQRAKGPPSSNLCVYGPSVGCMLKGRDYGCYCEVVKSSYSEYPKALTSISH